MLGSQSFRDESKSWSQRWVRVTESPAALRNNWNILGIRGPGCTQEEHTHKSKLSKQYSEPRTSSRCDGSSARLPIAGKTPQQNMALCRALKRDWCMMGTIIMERSYPTVTQIYLSDMLKKDVDPHRKTPEAGCGWWVLCPLRSYQQRPLWFTQQLINRALRQATFGRLWPNIWQKERK